MPLLTADDLVILVTFSRQQHHVARVRLVDDALDRRPAIHLTHDRLDRLARKTLLYRVQNRFRLLRARVIARDVNRIREFFGNFCHARALAGIAIAPAPEQHPQLAFLERPKRAQHVLQRIVRMSIIHQHAEWLPQPHRLQAPRGARGIFESRRDLVNGQAERLPNQRRREQRVLDIVPSDQAHFHFRAPVGRHQHEIASAGVDCHVAGLIIRFFAESKADEPRLALALHPCGPLVPHIQRGHGSLIQRREQLCLRGGVIFHRPVIIQVIARQVRETCPCKLHPRDPILIQRVARYFDCAAPAPLVAHARQQLGQLTPAGRRHRRLAFFAPVIDFDSADHPAALLHMLE